MDTRIIVGLAVGIVTALLVIVGVWFVYRRRQRSRNGFHLGGTKIPIRTPSTGKLYLEIILHLAMAWRVNRRMTRPCPPVLFRSRR